VSRFLCLRPLSASLTALGLLLLTTSPVTSVATADFDTHEAGFSLRVDDDVSALKNRAAFVLPNANVKIEAIGGPPGTYELEGKHGRMARRGPRTWTWIAAVAPGVYELQVDGPEHAGHVDVHVFVLVPARDIRQGILNGYRIGAYPASKNPIYAHPPGFVEVTKENEDTRLTPHFRLKQFLCKQEPAGQYPKYVVLRERLLLALEAVLADVNALGFAADSLNVMSAYRTPYYNAAIGDVPLSMHQFGGAADVFVDTKKKGQMDDLNRDGRIDVNDAAFLQSSIDRLFARPSFRVFEGGMGAYPATSAHPPFVHVDVRGVKARWKG